MADKFIRLPSDSGNGGPLVMLRDSGLTHPLTGEPVYANGMMSCDALVETAQTKFVTIDQVVGSNVTLVAAVALKRIRVIQCIVKSAANASVAFNSPSGVLVPVLDIVSALTGLLGGSGDMVIMPYSPVGWFQTPVGEALRITVAGATVRGILAYQEI